MHPLLTINEAMRRWKQQFASGQPDADQQKEPWRVFQLGKTPCLKGEAARLAFNRMDKQDAIYFRPDRDGSDLAAELFPGTDAAVFDCMGDIYIADPSFTWTYVHTRYDWCGPYFARAKKAAATRKTGG